MNNKNYFLQLAAACVAVIAFYLLLGIVGDYDYTEQIILSMSQEQDDSVMNHLRQVNGSTPSERQIAHWWAEHHQ